MSNRGWGSCCSLISQWRHC